MCFTAQYRETPNPERGTRGMIPWLQSCAEKARFAGTSYAGGGSEALVGQIYLVTVVAVLVSDLAQRRNR